MRARGHHHVAAEAVDRGADALVVGGDEHAVDAARARGALVDVLDHRLSMQIGQGLSGETGGLVACGDDDDDASPMRTRGSERTTRADYSSGRRKSKLGPFCATRATLATHISGRNDASIEAGRTRRGAAAGSEDLRLRSSVPGATRSPSPARRPARRATGGRCSRWCPTASTTPCRLRASIAAEARARPEAARARPDPRRLGARQPVRLLPALQGGRAAGLSDAQVEAIPAWPVADCFSPLERAVLAYTDCLVLDGGRVPDASSPRCTRQLATRRSSSSPTSTCIYEMHATMCRALRLEYDDVDERVVEIPGADGARTARRHAPGGSVTTDLADDPWLTPWLRVNVFSGRMTMTISKAVLITGCSTGIGRATAVQLAKSGYPVYATARKVDRSRISRHRAARSSRSTSATRRRCAPRCEGRGGARRRRRADQQRRLRLGGTGRGGADGARCGASSRPTCSACCASPSSCLPGMRRQGWGKIVNLSSMGGRLTFPGGGVYHATKYAVEALSDALRFEVARLRHRRHRHRAGPDQDRVRQHRDRPRRRARRQRRLRRLPRRARSNIQDAYEGADGAPSPPARRRWPRRSSTPSTRAPAAHALRRHRRRPPDDRAPPLAAGPRLRRLPAHAVPRARENRAQSPPGLTSRRALSTRSTG